MSLHYNLTVIGSGPGGYVAAVKAAKLGLHVCVVEVAEIGGTCLNWGCIPTKALIQAANEYNIIKDAAKLGFKVENIGIDMAKLVKRSRTAASILSKGVSQLFIDNKIDVFQGFGQILKSNLVGVHNENNKLTYEITSDYILIATGAKPRQLPGMEFDKTKIISSKEAMTLDHLPCSIVIIGGGAIGVEFAYIFNSLGSKVTLIEMLPHILPLEDTEIATELERSFARQKIKVITNTKVEKIEKLHDGVIVYAGDKEIQADLVLNAVGVVPYFEGLGIEENKIHLENGWIKSDRHSFATEIPSIYAIGDVNGPPYLAHTASAEGIVAVKHLAGKKPNPVNYRNIPACVYCHPQVASVGCNEQTAYQRSVDYKVGRFPFAGSGKGRAVGEIEGLVKVIVSEKDFRILGCGIVGGEATEMIAQVALAKQHNLNAKDFVTVIQAHPTFSECVKEAFENALDIAIHS
jgi:dihydrolipoamide dehydrogenase